MMVQYNKIFWLEDMPDFLEYYFSNGAHTGLNRNDLLARIAWAHDFEEGASIVQNSDFNLYVLDADFPDVCTPQHRKNVEDCLRMIKNNNFEYGNIIRDNNDVVTNNFVKFYQQFLLQSKNRVIVHSMSTLAPIFAFALNLPFYCKGGLNKDECKNDAQLWRAHIKMEAEDMKDDEITEFFARLKINKKSFDLNQLETYECGSAVHFIERYIL